MKLEKVRVYFFRNSIVLRKNRKTGAVRHRKKAKRKLQDLSSFFIQLMLI